MADDISRIPEGAKKFDLLTKVPPLHAVCRPFPVDDVKEALTLRRPGLVLFAIDRVGVVRAGMQKVRPFAHPAHDAQSAPGPRLGSKAKISL